MQHMCSGYYTYRKLLVTVMNQNVAKRFRYDDSTTNIVVFIIIIIIIIF